MTPTLVNLKNEQKVWLHLHQNDFLTLHKPKQIFYVSQAARIPKQKKTIEKSYYQNYTNEIFFILPVTYRTD